MILKPMSMQLQSKLCTFLRIETKSPEELQIVWAVNGSYHFQ